MYAVAGGIVCKVFIIIAVGFYAGKKGLIDDRASKLLSALMMDIVLPFGILSSADFFHRSAERDGNLPAFGSGVLYRDTSGVSVDRRKTWIYRIRTNHICAYCSVCQCGIYGVCGNAGDPGKCGNFVYSCP